MSADFRNVAILGSGLLGGSLAMALREQGSAPRLWARSESTAAQARELGIEGATSELAQAVSGADLLVLAVPVGAMPDLLKMALDCGIKSGALVTDVGSVKRLP
ncbi:MAG: prephenate dehydrogenase/arogenate dehydrogenase family protein, partial [Luteolibacter sp.]